ncbi:MAG TPA: hypothetical protein ENJ53_03275 [Phaeodactylibacter sp.]|nr:hypothetical protein [Phaeodactylibacter sp.]
MNVHFGFSSVCEKTTPEINIKSRNDRRRTADGGRRMADDGRWMTNGGRLRSAVRFASLHLTFDFLCLDVSSLHCFDKCKTFRRPPFAVCRSPSTVCRPSSAVCRSPSAVRRLPSAVHRPPFVVCRPSSIIR